MPTLTTKNEEKKIFMKTLIRYGRTHIRASTEAAVYAQYG
jgi:hypothetical protein